ncbi:hypothetical protein RI129_005822 [Pyrocoelia pectoralis]|uniref:Uncharacterized protein n=1 Tax=Pyrocoelia pectoralis TaxID=417401 RepID=A0AAN7ZHS6_9COLE
MARGKTSRFPSGGTSKMPRPRAFDYMCTKDKSPIEEVKSNKSNFGKEGSSNPSESKNNLSGMFHCSKLYTKITCLAIPLRIQSSQVSNKESCKGSIKMPRDVNNLTSVSQLSNLSGSTSPQRTNAAKGSTRVNKTTLISQFENKKKQLRKLEDELILKKSLVTDSYNILVELKKRLEESGVTNIELNELKLEVLPTNCEPNLVETMTDVINNIPSTLVETCKSVMNKRVLLLNTLDNFSKNKLPQEELQKSVKTYKEDTVTIEKLVNDQFKEQQDRVKDLVEKWVLLVKNSGDTANILNQVDELKEKLKEEEEKLASTTNTLRQALQDCEMYEKKCNQADANDSRLREKLEQLEQELKTQKDSTLSQRDKSSNFEQQKKLLKMQIQELERKCKESETKQNELQKNYKHAQDQLKTNEQRWMKEREEMISKGKHDKQLLEKLTKDRSCFETRVKSLEEYIADIDNTQKIAEDKLKKELEETRNLAVEEKVKRDTLQQKYEHVQSKLIQMEVRNNQAVDIVKTRNTFEPNEVVRIATEREAELYTDLLATRVALKAAEEKLQSYEREKMRFLDTIESLHAEKYSNESILLLQNVQKLTELENLISEKDEVIYRQQVEITGLTAEVENLNLKLSVPESGDTSLEESELKRMLYEGTEKLENMIKKSSENEQRAISFQYELNKRTKQLYDMENLLKARDGLITVLKAKKDELQLENSSFNNYADQIRTLLIQTREEVKTKNDLLQAMTTNLSKKQCEHEEQEKIIKQLECSLSIANEKRFKLQDAMGAMEKELQSTIAHTGNTWYDSVNFIRIMYHVLGNSPYLHGNMYFYLIILHKYVRPSSYRSSIHLRRPSHALPTH